MMGVGFSRAVFGCVRRFGVVGVAVFVVASASFYSPTAAAAATQIEALNNCNLDIARRSDTPNGVCRFNAVKKQYLIWYGSGQTSWTYCKTYGCEFSGTFIDCPARQRVSAGSNYKFYPYSDAVGPQDGVTCSGGCEMTYVVDTIDSHYELTGNLCPAHTGVDPTPVPVPDPPPENCTADGSCTWCDPISGKCVTASGGSSAPPAPPAPPSSAAGPNGSTDSSTTSTTNTGATSSDTTTTSTSTTTSTTTTTNVGGGTGGGGDGTGSTGTTGTGTSTTTGTSTSHTDVPASSSSTTSDSKCTTGVCDVGNADGNIGTLYEGGTSTVDSVYADFKADVSSAPIIGTVSSFFVVGNLSTACPAWHIPGNKYWGEAGFDFDFFCSPGMLAILELAGWLVLAMGAFCAVRIAIY